MISYNKTWMANRRLQSALKKSLEQGDLTRDEFNAIAKIYPIGFYTPKLLPRIGLFILTCVIVLFTYGLLSLMPDSNILESSGWLFFLGLISYTALELIVNLKNHFRSGVDDALLIISGCLFVTVISTMLIKNDAGFNSLKIWVIVFAVSLFLSARFADILVTAVCCASFNSVILFRWVETGPAGLITAPFVMMLFSAIVYWLASVFKNRQGFVNYQNCLVTAQISGLLTFYLSGNYYVVQTLGDTLKGITNSVNTTIPFGSFFWIWTILLPFTYIGFGVWKKDRILLRTGLILIVASTGTFRNYYHVFPLDVELIIVGTIILGAVFGLMKYLKTPKYGFTYARPGDSDKMDPNNIESLLIAGTISSVSATPVDTDVKFGGGDFGGGGSSGSF